MFSNNSPIILLPLTPPIRPHIIMKAVNNRKIAIIPSRIVKDRNFFYDKLWDLPVAVALQLMGNRFTAIAITILPQTVQLKKMTKFITML